MSMFREFEAYVPRVIDGDTFVGEIELGVGITLTSPVRLFGTNCPEINTDEGKRAKARVQQILEGKWIRLLMMKKKDKYGRILGDVQLFQIQLSELLVNEGHAVVMKGISIPDFEDWDIHTKGYRDVKTISSSE